MARTIGTLISSVLLTVMVAATPAEAFFDKSWTLTDFEKIN